MVGHDDAVVAAPMAGASGGGRTDVGSVADLGLFDLPPLAVHALRALLADSLGRGGRRQSHFIRS
jgi:hypothetical protein